MLLPTPPPEVLGAVLSRQRGPLPHAAPIARLRRDPNGGYRAVGDPEGVLERRRVANAKERERVRDPKWGGGGPGGGDHWGDVSFGFSVSFGVRRPTVMGVGGDSWLLGFVAFRGSESLE